MRTLLKWSVIGTTLLIIGTAFGPMDETVAMLGEVQPAIYAYATATTRGTLSRIAVRPGDKVEAGDLLATLDGWGVERDLAQNLADLAEARAELSHADALAKKTEAVPVSTEFLFSPEEVSKQQQLIALQNDHLARVEKLESKGVASSVEVMRLRMDLIAAESLLARAEHANKLVTGVYGISAVAEAGAQHDVAAAKVAALETHRKGLESEHARLEIHAPLAGIVTSTALIYPGVAVEPGQALFKIAQPGAVSVRLRANEDRIGSLKPGQKVRFRARSNPDRLTPYAIAHVISITPERQLTEATPDAQMGNYIVEASVDSAPYPLPPGVTVDAEVVLGSLPLYRSIIQKK